MKVPFLELPDKALGILCKKETEFKGDTRLREDEFLEYRIRTVSAGLRR
jgi:hypothetical protein